MRTLWLMDVPYFHSTLVPKILQMAQHETPAGVLQETDAEKRKAYYRQFNRLRDPIAVASDGVATIEVVGPLMIGATDVEKLRGASDYGDIQKDLVAAMDPKVRCVLLDISSGGGTAMGAPETADLVAALAAVKPVVAWTGSIMASAAYYIAAPATAIVASRSSAVGSVGTVGQVMDITPFLEKMGVKIHTITPAESDLKTTSYPTVPLTDAQREALTASVTATNNEFMGFVKTHRPAVQSDAMRGQTFSGTIASQNGLVDAVGSFEEARALALALASR